MTEQEVQTILSRLNGGLMDRSGINVEAHEWHAIAEFLAVDDAALADFRTVLDHETRRPFYKQGAFTPQGLVHCVDCLGQKGTSPRQLLDGDGLDVTRCMKCGCEMACRGDVADLNNLRLALPRGWYPRLEQTGGMTCNLFMDVAGHEYMVSMNDEASPKFVVCWFPDSEENGDISHHIGFFNEADEVVMAVTKYRFRFGARV